MKRRLLLSLVTMLVAVTSWADVKINSANFPDANFRSYLLSQPYGTDGTITDAEMAEIHNLMLSDKSISKLTGIKKFTALQYLSCDGNQLTKIDVSGCSALKELDCSGNQLTSLNVLGCTSLTSIICINNQIAGDAVDELISGLPSAGDAGLYFLNVEEDDNAITAEQVKAAGKKGWTVYALDEDWYKYTGVTVIIDETNFPDANFRNWVLSQTYGSDGKITDKEIAEITSLKVNGLNIEDLKGIEFFTELRSLECYDNKLTTLDVSHNTALTYLGCDNNQLESLDVSNNTALTKFECCENLLTSLDVSKNVALKYMDCSTNKLTSFDISQNTELTSLYICQNQIYGEEMDAFIASLPTVTNKGLYIIHDSNEGNAMTTIQVAAAKAKGWISYHSSDPDMAEWEVYAGENIKIDEKNFPDESFRNYLLSQSYGQDGELTDEEIQGITDISLYGAYGLKSLKGIEYFTALKSLYCTYKSGLTSLDLSKNTALESLYCYDCGLTSLDLSQNTKLKELGCYSNQLTALDLSNNIELEYLDCYSNQLTDLNLSKNVNLTSINCKSNQLDTLDLSKNTYLDDIDCSYNKLTLLELPTIGAEYGGALDCSNNLLTSLSVYFRHFFSLDCSFNKLTSLWFSYTYMDTGNPRISIFSNQLSSSAMQTFIGMLYKGNHTGTLKVLFPEDEKNVMTAEQAAFVKGRNWTPQYFDATDNTWKEYDGTTGVKNVSADGKGLSDGKYLKDGKLVIRKSGKEYDAAGAAK